MMKSKKILIWLLVAAIFFGLTACTADTPADPTDTTGVLGTTVSQSATEGSTAGEIGETTQGRPQTGEGAMPEKTPEQPTQGATEATKPAAKPSGNQPTKNGGFEVHFIDVGQADAALVLCDGKAMLIDGGNAEDSNLMYTYLKKKNISHLDYVVGTHAHEDHIGGIAGALNYASVGTAYSPVTAYSSKAFNNFRNAVIKHGVSLTVPSVGTSFSLGSAKCKILAVNTDSGDTNNTSIVLRITYGNTSFLFTGDAEREVEQALLNRGETLKSTVLKVGHHGSSSSTSYAFLREIMPEYAVISVGKGNSYGHPTESVLSRLRDAEVKTFRTDMQGDVICKSDGSTVSFSVSRNANVDTFGGIGGNSTQTQQQPTQKPTDPPSTQKPTEPDQPDEPDTPEQSGTHYILNTNSMKFHYADCASAKRISPKNRKDYYGTREELIEMGYSPCGNCDP